MILILTEYIPPSPFLPISNSPIPKHSRQHPKMSPPSPSGRIQQPTQGTPAGHPAPCRIQQNHSPNLQQQAQQQGSSAPNPRCRARTATRRSDLHLLLPPLPPDRLSSAPTAATSRSAAAPAPPWRATAPIRKTRSASSSPLMQPPASHNRIHPLQSSSEDSPPDLPWQQQQPCCPCSARTALRQSPLGRATQAVYHQPTAPVQQQQRQPVASRAPPPLAARCRVSHPPSERVGGSNSSPHEVSVSLSLSFN